MIINKATISQPPTLPLRVPTKASKNHSQVYSPQLISQNSEADDLHFDDSHFNARFRVQNKNKVKDTQTTTTFIKKVSIVQMHSPKKGSENQAISSEGRSMIRQGIANFLNYPIESAAFTPEISNSEGNYHRNYTSCSIRRKASSNCSTYQSRRQLPTPSRKQETTQQVKCEMIRPFICQESLHKRKEHLDTNYNQRRFNSIDYCIIKPHEIQAAPISHRHKYKVKDFDRSYCPDLLATLRKKEEILQKHRQLQMERQQLRIRISRQSSSRSNIHTSFQNRRAAARVEQRNEVLPWEVDSNLVDII